MEKAVHPVTLENIALQKAALKEDIRQQKEVIGHCARQIFAPFSPATSKAGSIMQTFHTGMAIFDGILLGMKVMRKIRKVFNLH